jgi:hypothetical protein
MLNLALVKGIEDGPIPEPGLCEEISQYES